MPPADLGTTNVWLALIAIASILQLLIVIGLLIGSYRLFRRLEKAVDRMSDELIAPVAVRAHKFLDEAEELMLRASGLIGLGHSPTDGQGPPVKFSCS